ELFSYNRENFKFDQDQRIEREALRLEMQVKRFELFREDVRDLVELTVDRMDVYHLVGALFLEFCIVLFCEGRVQASAPPFLLSLFLLSNACAFIYLLLAVWLSMHASIASHSFGVRLLTRFVRLPIPSMKQIAGLRSTLKDYERQGVANLLRLPFQDQQEWQQVELRQRHETCKTCIPTY
ncbi:CCHC-type domain-containing protein, partial [Durusdinium trenchii]